MARYEINNIPAPIDFECNNDDLKRTLQNCKNLLMAHMGEVPYDRYRGFDPALYDLPMSKLKAELMPELDRLFMWEPDAKAVSADARLDDKGNVVLTVIMEIDL